MGHRRLEYQGVPRRGRPGGGGRVAPLRGAGTRPGSWRRCWRGSAAEAAPRRAVDAHAVTMTAELSRAFLTKREGVAFVLDAVESALGSARRPRVHGGRHVRRRRPRPARDPLRVAAANWMARRVPRGAEPPRRALRGHRHDHHRHHPDRRGRGRGRAGAPIRSAWRAGELLYTGAVRTPVEALAAHVARGRPPLRAGRRRVCDERRRARVARRPAGRVPWARRPTAGRRRASSPAIASRGRCVPIAS